MEVNLKEKQRNAIKGSKTSWAIADGCGKMSTLFLAVATVFAMVGYGAALVSDKKTGQAKKLHQKIKENNK